LINLKGKNLSIKFGPFAEGVIKDKAIQDLRKSNLSKSLGIDTLSFSLQDYYQKNRALKPETKVLNAVNNNTPPEKPKLL